MVQQISQEAATMILRLNVPTSKKGKRLARVRARTLTPEMRSVTSMWGRAGQPGLARVSTHYRERA